MSKRKFQPPAEATLPPTVEKRDYVDERGIHQRVIVPNGETDLKTGIPVSLDVSSLYGHMPDTWQRDFYEALHAQGLVEPGDFFKPGAADRFKAAMLSVIRHDFLSVQALANEELSHAS